MSRRLREEFRQAIKHRTPLFLSIHMARDQVKPSIEKSRRQAQEKRPQGIEKRPQPLRRSARLQRAQQNKEPKHLLSSPPITNPLDPKALHRLPSPDPKAVTPSCPPRESEAHRKSERKRKRSQEVEISQDRSSGKRPRAANNGGRNSHPIEDWLQKGSWPKEYFESGNQTWEDLKADISAGRPEANEMNGLSRLLAKKKSAASLASLRRQALEANMIAPSEETEDKSLPYRSPGYENDLEMKGSSYLRESPEGITEDSKLDCQSLLTTTQAVPLQSLFGDSQFGETCEKLRNRNEARIVEDASPLIAPSPETLKTFGAIELEHLIFNTNERWGESIPITKTCPQPDRCVGFSRSAFTIDQLQKLTPYTGSLIPIEFHSPFLATWRMYFPFFTCEAKSAVGDLDVADKQNAHSMTMAVRGIVELFKAVNREEELHQKILAFSISHDASVVRIYGHYALIKDRVAKFYRHPIHAFDFTAQNGKDKWTAYQFTKNIYFKFMPTLHALICSAIDQISLDTAPSLPRSNPPHQIPPGDSFTSTDLESEQPDSQDLTLSAPGSQDPLGPKKRRLTGNAVLERQLDRRDEELERVKQENQWLRQGANSEKDSKVETMLQKQFEDQKRESKEQLERQQQEQISKLQDLLVEQKEQNKEQMEQYKEQMEQYKEIIKMLKQQKRGKG